MHINKLGKLSVNYVFRYKLSELLILPNELRKLHLRKIHFKQQCGSSHRACVLKYFSLTLSGEEQSAVPTDLKLRIKFSLAIKSLNYLIGLGPFHFPSVSATMKPDCFPSRQ